MKRNKSAIVFYPNVKDENNYSMAVMSPALYGKLFYEVGFLAESGVGDVNFIPKKEKFSKETKAWQSLMKKGFRFTGWHIEAEGKAQIVITGTVVPDIVEELDILFHDENKDVKANEKSK